MLNRKTLSALIAGAAVTSACTIPEETLSDTITYPFSIQVQNASRPEVHNEFFKMYPWGGGDAHLFIGPVGLDTYDLTLVDGVITHDGMGVQAVINGEWSEIDDTTKLFMTGRSDPRAFFQPTYACNPDTDELQIELTLVGRQYDPPGGVICVRESFDNSHEFRYSPPGNTLIDPNRECITVTLVVIPTTELPPTSTVATTITTSTVSSTVATTSSTSTSSTSTAPTATPSTDPSDLFTDLTALGWRFLGCSPEERWTTDGAFRTLPDVVHSSDTMTNQWCVAWCEGQGFKYAGTEWNRECWCGNAYASTRAPGTTIASLATCDYPCTGDSTQICGGDAWLSLYEKCEEEEPCENQVFT